VLFKRTKESPKGTQNGLFSYRRPPKGKTPYAVDSNMSNELLFLGRKRPLTVFAGANIKPFFRFRKTFPNFFLKNFRARKNTL
ncbi:MAG: hypothetical protein KDD13_10530, partial [Mangrovimonas sp.]|nr:hypothetical protein [Mangrovimonas sp.]